MLRLLQRTHQQYPLLKQATRVTVQNKNVENIVKIQISYYSTKRPSFFSRVIDNFKQEIEKNKEMSDNIKKFREEANKLEQSDALKSARQKFNTVEAEASKGGEALKETIGTIKEKVGKVLDDAGKTDIAKKASQIGEEISKSAQNVSDTIAEKGSQLGRTGAFQTISEAVKSDMDNQGLHGRVYRSPKKLRKRIEIPANTSNRQFDPNEDATGVELHKDSKFYQQWEDFKNNNQYVNKVLDWKMKYDESENPVIRGTRFVTERITGLFGGVFSKTELSETLTEICKIDPNFDQKQFLQDCENDIIPNILEAMVRGNVEILKDWCFESTYNVIATPIIQAQKLGYYLDSKILDIENVDIAMGKVMEQGPVLIITFQTQQIMCVKDSKNNVVEGSPDKVMRVNYVWVLCRDPNELNPKSAWRLMDISANSTEQFV